jgi:hypothetical protein
MVCFGAAKQRSPSLETNWKNLSTPTYETLNVYFRSNETTDEIRDFPTESFQTLHGMHDS